jgi:hypothetical protein
VIRKSGLPSDLVPDELQISAFTDSCHEPCHKPLYLLSVGHDRGGEALAGAELVASAGGDGEVAATAGAGSIRTRTKPMVWRLSSAYQKTSPTKQGLA